MDGILQPSQLAEIQILIEVSKWVLPHTYCFCVLWQDWPVHTLGHLEPTAGRSGWIETALQELVTGKLYATFLQARCAHSQLELNVKPDLVNHIKAQVRYTREGMQIIRPGKLHS